MSSTSRYAITLLVVSTVAHAQPAPPDQPPPTPAPDGLGIPGVVDPNATTTTTIPSAQDALAGSAQAIPAAPQGPKVPKRGDFDAGGDVRFPSGPDASGKYATYNWIAADLKGRYYLLDSVTVNANVPLAVIHPGTLMDGTSPDMIGGITARIDATLPKMPSMPGMKNDTQIGLTLTLAYMRQGAMLLSDKEFPLFTGSFEPGLNVGVISKIKLSSLLYFSLQPVWVHQAGSGMNPSESAVQIPTSLILGLGNLVKLSADLGVFTGNDYSFSGSKGGQIYAGGSLDVKIGPIIAHAGAGFASLLTGPDYPTIGDSLYIDVNVKYAK
jgi:hypothetical protein